MNKLEWALSSAEQALASAWTEYRRGSRDEAWSYVASAATHIGYSSALIDRDGTPARDVEDRWFRITNGVSKLERTLLGRG